MWVYSILHGFDMGTFDRQIATAKRLIAKNGRTCVWRALENDAPVDVNKPWKKGIETTDDATVKIVLLPDTRANLAFLQTLTNETISIGDDYGLMASVDFVPTKRAEVYDETGTKLLRSVKSVDTLAPNGEVVLHTIRFTVAP